MSITKLARFAVQKLTPYLSARRIGGAGDVWLNANESPFNNSYQTDGTNLNRYPECQPSALLHAYADYAGLNTDQVLISRGADEGIDLLIRTFCESNKDSILICPPTYGIYKVSAKAAELKCKTVPLLADWQLDLDEISRQLDDVKLVFVCNPNNPTGSLVDSDSLLALLKMTEGRAIVVIDEAYIEFSAQASCVPLLSEYQHLAILRTLSKAFALAGLRCGFTLSSPEIIALMQKVIAPYPVPTPVISIACQALSKQGIERMQLQVKILNDNRESFSHIMAEFDEVRIFPSVANFVLVVFTQADEIFKALWEQGVIARRTEIENAIRFSIGTKEECNKTLKLIAQQLQKR